MICKDIIEFLLWNDCHAHGKCAFCWQQAKHDCTKFLDEENKNNSINCVRQFLQTNFDSSDGIKKNMTGNHILLVGGEIFDVVEHSVADNLKNLLLYIVSLMNNDDIELLYINTNLLYKDLSLLYFLLDLIRKNSLFDRLRFTTSWDLIGRFESKEKLDIFDYNIKEVKNKYPDVHIVVNMILTKQMCNHIINKPTFINDFESNYNVQVNTIPYIVLTDFLAPTKNEVMTALLAINSVNPNYIENYVNNFSLPQKKNLYEYNSKDKKLIYCSSDIDNCGHSVNFKNYCTDKSKCYICDIIQLKNEVVDK